MTLTEPVIFGRRQFCAPRLAVVPVAIYNSTMVRRRKTRSRALVLAVLLDATGDTWGLRIAEQTGLSPATTYRILDRLEADGIVRSSWERVNPRVVGRPRRRLYRLLMGGRPMAMEEAETLRTVPDTSDTTAAVDPALGDATW